MDRLGKILVITGILITIAGLIIWFLGDKLRFLGRLPGDIRIERETFNVYIPITTMILISIVLSAIMWLIQRLK